MAVDLSFKVSLLPQHPKISEKIASNSDTPQNQTDMLVAKIQTAQDWDGPDDPEDPLNWPIWKKVYHTAMVGFLCFTMYASTLHDSF